MKLNLDYLVECIWEHLDLIRIITKKPGCAPDFDDAIVLRNGVTVKHVCHAIHRSIPELLKYALVWVRNSSYQVLYQNYIKIYLQKNLGMYIICFSFIFQGTSTKFDPQRVGPTHKMHDEDVIQIVKK